MKKTSIFIVILLLIHLLFPAFAQEPSSESSSLGNTNISEDKSKISAGASQSEGLWNLQRILLDLLIILVAAKLGGIVAQRLKQPMVLGELSAGIIIGPSLLKLVPSPLILLKIAGESSGYVVDNLANIMEAKVIGLLCQIGVIILLFQVGLGYNIREFVRVGKSSLLVAILGIIVSFVLGYAASLFFAKVGYWSDIRLIHLFIGGTLTATSIGITAGVLSDLGKLRSKEARIILGAAALNDVGGLIILSGVTVLYLTGTLRPQAILTTTGIGIGFLILSLWIGVKWIPRWFNRVVKLRVKGILITTAFSFMLLMSYLADVTGLAYVIGAFVAGLILAQAFEHNKIRDQLKPIGEVFIPFFFVAIGIMVDLSGISGNLSRILIIAGVFSVVAIISELISGWGVIDKTVNRYAVGVGMIPRGEVALVFAVYGLLNRIILPWQYTALVIMIMVTTFITPVWLRRALPELGERNLPNQ
ncbi:MAG: cation:proton antiporter [Nitrospirae bacterium]|nr:cation:proton antiporter [Nitrospirota bacterium]